MKIIRLLAIMALIVIASVSCKKTEGPIGPQGTAGVNGTNGTNGNADVRMFGYGPCTLTAANFYEVTYYPLGLTSGLIDSSAILAYYRAAGSQWNMANGYGPNANYATILYTDPTPYISIYLRNPDGAGYSGADVTWDSVRIVVIPANLFKIARQEGMDFSDYNEVVNSYCLH